jgi:hypothetical protein
MKLIEYLTNLLAYVLMHPLPVVSVVVTVALVCLTSLPLLMLIMGEL